MSRCRGGRWLLLRRRCIATGLLLLALAMPTAEAAKYAKICELHSSPAVSLEYDAATRQFSLASEASDETDESEGARRLERQIVVVGKQDSGRRFLRAESAANQTAPASGKTTYIARSCPCDGSGRTYCLIDGISTGAIPDSCGVPWSGDPMFTMAGYNYSTFDTSRIGCFELNSQTVFIRNAWPVVVLWYGALTIFLIATSNGKFARAYIMNKLCPGLHANERMVDRILARESEMRNRLRTAAMRAASVAEGPGRYLVRTRGVRIPNRGARRREDLSDEEERQEATRWWIEQAERLGILSPRQDVEWVLRTKTFNAEKERAKREQRHLAKLQAKEQTEQVQQESSLSDEDDDTFECTICLANIEDGDQVGVLPCTHIFHSECLRLWIARKNACPLCQVTEIASPRPVQRENDSSSSAEGNSDGNGDGENAYSTSARAETRRNAAVAALESGRTSSWFAPTFFFPSSEPERARSTTTRMELSPSSSSMSDGERQTGGQSPRQQRRQRMRERQSQDFVA